LGISHKDPQSSCTNTCRKYTFSFIDAYIIVLGPCLLILDIVCNAASNPRIWVVPLVPVSEGPPFRDPRDSSIRSAKLLCRYGIKRVLASKTARVTYHNLVFAVKEIHRIPARNDVNTMDPNIHDHTQGIMTMTRIHQLCQT